MTTLNTINSSFINYRLVFSSVCSSSLAVGEDGSKAGIELYTSGEGDTFSDDEDDVSLTLGSPENCKLLNAILSIGVPWEGGVQRKWPPSTGVDVRCLVVSTLL